MGAASASTCPRTRKVQSTTGAGQTKRGDDGRNARPSPGRVVRDGRGAGRQSFSGTV